MSIKIERIENTHQSGLDSCNGCVSGRAVAVLGASSVHGNRSFAISLRLCDKCVAALHKKAGNFLTRKDRPNG